MIVLEYITFRFEVYPVGMPGRISPNAVTTALEFILRNNFFMLDTTYCRLKCVIAIMVRGLFELKIYHSSLLKFVTAFHNYLTEHWQRPFDDCLITLNDSIDKLLNLKIMFNSISSNIQFNLDYSDKQLPFLDILIKILKNHLEI